MALSYVHSFHAGSCVDVLKHALLRQIIQLRALDKPFVYVDTHAGSGLYDLFSGQAQATREHDNGVSRVFSPRELVGRQQAFEEERFAVSYHSRLISEQIQVATRAAQTAALLAPRKFTADCDEFLEPYLQTIVRTNKLVGTSFGVTVPQLPGVISPSALLRWYPGSPVVAALTLKREDSMVLFETKKDTYSYLKQHLAFLNRASLFVKPIQSFPKSIDIRQSDGFEGAASFLETIPSDAAGLLHVDPVGLVPAAQYFIAMCAARPNLTMLLWHPHILPAPPPTDAVVPAQRAKQTKENKPKPAATAATKIDPLVARLAASLPPTALRVSVSLRYAASLRQFGFAIINPPAGLRACVARALPELNNALHCSIRISNPAGAVQTAPLLAQSPLSA